MRITLLSFFLSVVIAAMAGCPEVKLKVKRLPNLNVPRAGHAVFVVNGELTVVGGHTGGFVPTATAEYYGDGEWHLMPTVYTHDQGLCVPMSDGRVMLAGGHEKELGIGQTFTVELYHPATHSFEGYGCLDKKRTWACGIELDSGHVVISGNWYGDDGMEFGFKSDGGSNGNPFLCIDGIKLYKIGEADPVEMVQADISDLEDQMEELKSQAIIVGYKGLCIQIENYIDELEEVYDGEDIAEMEAAVKQGEEMLAKFKKALDTISGIDAILAKMQTYISPWLYTGIFCG